MPNTVSKEDFIREVIVDNFGSDDYVSLNNEYCNETGYMDDYIEYMDMFDDVMDGYTPTDIARMVIDGDFSINDNYFKFTIYGVESFSYPDDEMDLDEIISYICENDNDLGDSDVRAALDEWEENENDHDSFKVDEWDEDEEVEEGLGRHSRLRMPKRESTKRVKRSRKINEDIYDDRDNDLETLDISEAKNIKRWADKAVKEFEGDSNHTSWYDLGSGLAVAMGWSGGFDPNDTDYDIVSLNDPSYHLMVKICNANSDYLHDYEFMDMPYNPETGDVWDTEIPANISLADAKWLIDQYNEIIKDGTLVW